MNGGGLAVNRSKASIGGAFRGKRVFGDDEISGVAKCKIGRTIKHGIIVGLTLFLSACTTLMPLPPLATVVTEEARYFAMIGRLSIRRQDRFDSVKMVWTRAEREERLQFFTPFGSQVAEIVKEIRADKSVQVTLNNGSQITRAATMDELTEAALGVALEVDQIARWVQGIGVVDNVSQDIQLRDGTLWHVTAERFQDALPHRYASRIAAVKDGGDVSLKLVVDEWAAK